MELLDTIWQVLIQIQQQVFQNKSLYYLVHLIMSMLLISQALTIKLGEHIKVFLLGNHLPKGHLDLMDATLQVHLPLKLWQGQPPQLQQQLLYLILAFQEFLNLTQVQFFQLIFQQSTIQVHLDQEFQYLFLLQLFPLLLALKHRAAQWL